MEITSEETCMASPCSNKNAVLVYITLYQSRLCFELKALVDSLFQVWRLSFIRDPSVSCRAFIFHEISLNYFLFSHERPSEPHS